MCVRVGDRERVSDRESKSEGKREKWKEREGGPMIHRPYGKKHGGELGRFEYHAGLFVGVFQKSILNRVCQLLAINAHKMAQKTGQRFQVRVWDAPTFVVRPPPFGAAPAPEKELERGRVQRVCVRERERV